MACSLVGRDSAAVTHAAAALLPPFDDKQHVFIGPDGHYRGSPGIEKHLIGIERLLRHMRALRQLREGSVAGDEFEADLEPQWPDLHAAKLHTKPECRNAIPSHDSDSRIAAGRHCA